MSNGRGRPKGKKESLILLDYRTWIIEYDGSAWPCVNYVLRKKGTNKIAYCDSLESALKLMHDEMLVDYVNRQNDYGARFSDLARAIKSTKNEISTLFTIPKNKKIIEKGEKKK